MSLLVEKYGNYSFIQALGASFKEVQGSPKAIRGTLKGIIGMINTVGLVLVLGAPAYALAQGLRIADRTLKVYQGTAKIDLWANYKFKGFLILAKDVGSTFCYVVALPQLLYDMKVIATKIPTPISVVTDAIDLLSAIHDLSQSIPKAFVYRTDRPLKRIENRIKLWNDILEDAKKGYGGSINAKKLDKEVLDAALITYAHDKTVKWENKKETLYIREKSNLHSIAFNVSMASLMSFLLIGATTALPVAAGIGLSGLSLSYWGLHSFLYDTFNPEVKGVKFNH